MAVLDEVHCPLLLDIPHRMSREFHVYGIPKWPCKFTYSLTPRLQPQKPILQPAESMMSKYPNYMPLEVTRRSRQPTAVDSDSSCWGIDCPRFIPPLDI
jgi:hypothetical protein